MISKIEEERDAAYKALEQHYKSTQLCRINGHRGAWMWVDTNGGFATFRQVCVHCSQVSVKVLAPEEEIDNARTTQHNDKENNN